MRCICIPKRVIEFQFRRALFCNADVILLHLHTECFGKIHFVGLIDIGMPCGK